MSPETVFLISVYGVLPAWLLLAGALFTAGDVPEGASFVSLRGVMLFFTVPGAALAGWIHYLVFDLFVGAWQVRDARRRGIPHLAVLPCLLLTLALGPIGLLLYLGLRLALRRELSLEE